jgi:hypothetical protein
MALVRKSSDETGQHYRWRNIPIFPFWELQCMPVSVCFHNLVTYAQRLQDLHCACLMFWKRTHWIMDLCLSSHLKDITCLKDCLCGFGNIILGIVQLIGEIEWKQKSMRYRRSFLHYRACDMRLADWRGDFAILYLAQSLAQVPYGIDANDCQYVKPNGNWKWIPYPRFLSKNLSACREWCRQGKLSMARAAWLKVTCRMRDRVRRIR